MFECVQSQSNRIVIWEHVKCIKRIIDSVFPDIFKEHSSLLTLKNRQTFQILNDTNQCEPTVHESQIMK